ncbi:MAG: hypothetical protein B6U73_02760 [Desulfurococcales archaeon ex4484_204]|nr:MAG: hypothetical protein B6U73_02760 [Desulfurococcales archaeon ex4484_204]
MGPLLVAVGVTLLVTAAVFLTYSKHSCSTSGGYRSVPGLSVGAACREYLGGDNVSVTARSNVSVLMYFMGYEAYEDFLRNRGLSYYAATPEGCRGFRANVSIPSTGTYCLVIDNKGGEHPALIRFNLTTCRYVRTEVGNALTSVSGSVLIVLGLALSLKHLVKSVGKGVKEELRIGGGLCRTLSMSKHRCTIATSYEPSEAVKVAVEVLTREFSYGVVRAVAPTITVLRRRGKGLVPRDFSSKPVTLIVSSSRDGYTTLTLDYEVGAWSASGTLDLEGVFREASRVFKAVGNPKQFSPP